jgi:hypothetical protein
LHESESSQELSNRTKQGEIGDIKREDTWKMRDRCTCSGSVQHRHGFACCHRSTSRCGSTLMCPQHMSKTHVKHQKKLESMCVHCKTLQHPDKNTCKHTCENTWNTCIYMQHSDLLLQHPDETVTTYV